MHLVIVHRPEKVTRLIYAQQCTKKDTPAPTAYNVIFCFSSFLLCSYIFLSSFLSLSVLTIAILEILTRSKKIVTIFIPAPLFLFCVGTRDNNPNCSHCTRTSRTAHTRNSFHEQCLSTQRRLPNAPRSTPVAPWAKKANKNNTALKDNNRRPLLQNEAHALYHAPLIVQWQNAAGP